MLIDVMGHPMATMKPEIAVRDPRIAKFVADADDVFRQLQLTVVCVRCGATPVMQNHPSDPTWRMECLCARRVIVNPSPTGVS